MFKDYLKFVKALGSNPLSTGAIAPSSRALGKALTRPILDPGAPHQWLEIGPGTGAITQVISELLNGQNLAVNCYTGLELSPEMLKILRPRFPDLKFIEGSAENLDSFFKPDSLSGVVCSLPWALLGPAKQNRILAQIYKVLRVDGVFTTFSYLHGLVLPSNWTLYRLMGRRFPGFQREQVVWGNIPPALVLKASKNSQNFTGQY